MHPLQKALPLSFRRATFRQTRRGLKFSNCGRVAAAAPASQLDLDRQEPARSIRPQPVRTPRLECRSPSSDEVGREKAEFASREAVEIVRENYCAIAARRAPALRPQAARLSLVPDRAKRIDARVRVLPRR